MIYRVHPDYRHYKSFVFDHEAVRKALGGETQFHFARAPQRYQQGWQSFEIAFEALSSGTAGIPDIMVRNGRLFLTQAACQALFPLTEAAGEFLPITYDGRDGLLFNILFTAEDMGGLDTERSLKNEFGEVQALGFHDEKVKDMPIFRTAFDNYLGVYCSDVFKWAVEEHGLKGLIFSTDTGNMFPPDEDAQVPARH